MARGNGKARAEDSEGPYAIGELARSLEITTRAIRFYESKGLIKPKRRDGARIYDRRDRARLILVLRGKNLGFSLEDIAQYLRLYDADPCQVAQTALLIDKVNVSIADLEHKREDIDRTLRELKDIRERATEFLRRHGEGHGGERSAPVAERTGDSVGDESRPDPPQPIR